MRQGCSPNPTLFQLHWQLIYADIEQSVGPGHTLCDTKVKGLLYADDLVVPSLTKQGVQQNLALLQEYCLTWALAVNLKAKVMILQKKGRCLQNRFTLGNTVLEHTLNYTAV